MSDGEKCAADELGAATGKPCEEGADERDQGKDAREECGGDKDADEGNSDEVDEDAGDGELTEVEAGEGKDHSELDGDLGGDEGAEGAGQPSPAEGAHPAVEGGLDGSGESDEGEDGHEGELRSHVEEAFRGTPLETDMHSVMAKIQQSLEGKRTVDAAALTDRFSVLGDDHVLVDPATWTDLARSLERQEQIEVRYEKFDGTRRLSEGRV